MPCIENALVVGAGIGGLAMTAALARQGIAATTVEVRPDSMVLGVGINQPANSLRALKSLGVLDEILAVGYEFDHFRFADYRGETIVDVPATMGGDDVPANVALTRRDLHDILIGAGERAGASVRYGTTVTDVADRGDHVDVTFSDGSTGIYDLVIGFDGIKSPLRRRLFGDGFEAQYTGFAVWRVTVPRPPEATHCALFQGINIKAGYIPLNQQEMYLLVVTPEPEDARFAHEDLVGALRERLAPFGGPVAEIRDGLDDDADVVYGLLREVLLPAPWHRGRIVLAGDAAHACTPHLTQGAAMALEDAVVLADEIGRNQEVAGALEAFSARRFPRVKFVQAASRAILDGEMQVTSDEALEYAAAHMRAELAGQMGHVDEFLKAAA